MADRYWVGGTGNWSASNGLSWSASSGGAPGASVPTAADNVFFDANSNTGTGAFTVTMTNSPRFCNNFTASGLDGVMTLAGLAGVDLIVSGSLFFPATNFICTYTGITTFNATTTGKTVTTNGVAFGASVTFSGVGGTWQLQSALTTPSVSTIALTAGTLDLNNFTLTAGAFASNSSNPRSIAFGTTGAIVVNTGSAGQTVLSMATATNFTFTGTSNISAVMSVTRTFNFGGTAGATTSNRLNINLTSGASVPTFTGSFRQINFTGSTSNIGAVTISCHGFTLASGGTYSNTRFATVGDGTLTYAGKLVAELNINGSGITTTLADAGQNIVTILTQGTLDLQSYTLTTLSVFSSNNSNTRTIAFGTGNITCTGTGTVWGTSTVTALTTTGTQVVNVTSVGSTAISVLPGALSEANSISFNFTGGTYTLTFLGTANDAVRNVNFTGFAGTWGATSTGSIYGNLTLSTGMTLTASASPMTFAATSGTKTITSNGKTIDFPVTFNGVGGTWQLQDALTLGSTRNALLTNGTLDLNAKTMTVGTAFTINSGTKNITFNGGTLVCPAASTTAFNNTVPTGFTTTAGIGVGTISMTAATAKAFQGGGATYNCTLNQGGAGALTITGSNTFNDITNTVQPASVLFTAGATNTFLSDFSLSGTPGNLITIDSTSAANHTLSKASGTVSVSYCSVSRSSATGGATWQSFVSNGNVDGGNNTGWDFGGVIYAALISETATATDAVVGGFLFLGSVFETATATDTILVAPSVFNAPVTETSTATDSVLSFASFEGSVSETSAATDAISSFADFGGLISETSTATDSVLSFASFEGSVSETSAATDAISSFADFGGLISETSTATDSVLSFASFEGSVSETSAATDAISSFADFGGLISETSTATDAILVAPSVFNAPVTETSAATDAVSPPGSIYNAPIVETVVILDSIVGVFLWNLIDDSQTVTWQNINSSPGTAWSSIDTDPDTGWTVTPTVN